MSEPRDIRHEPPAAELRVASRDLVRAYGGGEAAAALIGRRQQHWSDCGAPNTTRWLTIDDAARLEDHTAASAGFPHVTGALARRQGFSLAPGPRALPSDGDLITMVAGLGREFGEASAAICGAVADRKVTRREAARARGELWDVMEQAATLMAALQCLESEQ